MGDKVTMKIALVAMGLLYAGMGCSTSPELAAHMKAEMAKWSKVIRESGIRID